MFDWNEMAKRSLGPYWKERTAAERAEFVQLFAELFQRTYLSRIELADRERFQYLGEPVEGESATVRTSIVTKKNRQIPVDYLTRRTGGQWRIYDLSVGGTSLVNNYRAQFTALVARSSYQDLIEKLRALAGKRSGATPTGGFVLDGVVFTLGDHAYEAGTPIEFAACYEPSWGRHLVPLGSLLMSAPIVPALGGRPSSSCRITTRLASHASRCDVPAGTWPPSSSTDWPGCSESARTAASTCTTTWYRSPGAPGSSS